jgi:hypothetical protein
MDITTKMKNSKQGISKNESQTPFQMPTTRVGTSQFGNAIPFVKEKLCLIM